MYYGRAASADEYFSVLGFPLPYRINAADHILDLASGDISTPARHAPNAPVQRAALAHASLHAWQGVPLLHGRVGSHAGRALESSLHYKHRCCQAVHSTPLLGQAVHSTPLLGP